MVARHTREAGASDVPMRKARRIKKERSSVCARKDSSFCENVDKRKHLAKTIRGIDRFGAATIRRVHDFHSRETSANCVELNS
jgi:hypothetical protein